ncbi:hypothetical protein C9374_004115 [Naegleria lovaniensis]|uniref:Uncharacterized protein n=1 Tax=Naegleria lovaniensis TaxID=51637 RepID=A0AA88GM12_NAELO|nr:uncharacterized protein C9374_004115 [Naegleria lovaniensis]KAG2383444.1 hypothetical protein C9374_004115 [Naegleria lovaniensis]
MKRKISAEGMVSSDNSSEINNDGREPPSKKEKQYSSNHVFSILREYDPYILQKIFSYCHPKFMFETLMITCSEWYLNYFQKKQFVLFLKEWLLERWKFLIRDLDTHELDDEQKSAIIPDVLQKFNTEMKDEKIEQLLKYGLRFLKLFLNEHPFKRRKTTDTMSDEDDEDEEDEILEEESTQSENEEERKMKKRKRAKMKNLI